MTIRLCWVCKQPATHTLTRDGSIPLDACDHHTRVDRPEAERLGWTVETIAPASPELTAAEIAREDRAYYADLYDHD